MIAKEYNCEQEYLSSETRSHLLKFQLCALPNVRFMFQLFMKGSEKGSQRSRTHFVIYLPYILPSYHTCVRGYSIPRRKGTNCSARRRRSLCPLLQPRCQCARGCRCLQRHIGAKQRKCWSGKEGDPRNGIIFTCANAAARDLDLHRVHQRDRVACK